jgi:16S rRNA (uracil1498-N3)-methyltransferase
VSERFYCPDPPQAGRYRLGPEESRHLARVCRLGIGDFVEIFDGRGFATLAEVVGSSADRTEVVAVGEPIVGPSPSCSLVLATAIPKGDRFDWLIEKATELGVDRLIPIVAERSVVVPRGTKLNRLRRSIIEASKQCRRARLMELGEPVEWPQIVGESSGSARFLADPLGVTGSTWPDIPRGAEIVLAVGPEGGFTGPETELAIGTGWFPIRLGYNILRVETAGLAGCAALLARVAETDE